MPFRSGTMAPATRGGPRLASALAKRGKQKRILVPMYFHVLQSRAKAGTVTLKMAKQQAAAMNRAYKPAGITFFLKQTTFTTNDAWAVGAGGDSDAAKKALRQGTYSALNIYFHTDFAGGNLGTCTLPANLPPGATPAQYYSDGCNVNAGDYARRSSTRIQPGRHWNPRDGALVGSPAHFRRLQLRWTG